MSTLVLIPGEVDFAAWRAIYRGADFRLDESAFGAIAAAEASVRRIVDRDAPVYGINTGFGKLASTRIESADLETLQRYIILSHSAGVGEATPRDVVRLMIALKLTSLAQGASGIRVETIKFMEAYLQVGIVPIIPCQGSVGASGDLAPLAHMSATFLGYGEVEYRGQKIPAAQALSDAGLRPLVPGPKEGLALLNGTQFSTANALAGLFDAEVAFRNALVSGALATEAVRGSDAPFDARIQTLRRHRGQIEAAAAIRGLMAGSEIRASHLTNDDRIQDPYCMRCQPQVMGAALDVLRQAATTLGTEANAVSDNPLIFPETDEALSGGNFHAEPVAFAADMIALALCEIGSLAERRIAMLVDPSLSGLPAFLTPQPGLNSGFMIAQVTSAALTSENKQMAYPASVDSIPTSANQEDHVSMAAHGARRLRPMTANVRNILAIEFLAAAQGCDLLAPLVSSDALERVRAAIRARVPLWAEDRYLAPDMAAIANAVATGALVDPVAAFVPEVI